MSYSREDVLTIIEGIFRRYEKAVGQPAFVKWRAGQVFRYTDKSIEAALVQKLARVISALRAIDVLLAQGFVQECGVLSRTLDELHDDIYFLALPLTNGKNTSAHKRYLKWFYSDQLPEHLDLSKPLPPRVQGPTRKEIQDEIAKTLGIRKTPALDVLNRVYSGYVHAASQNIMDMCGGDPPRFHVRGMQGTPLVSDSRDDSWNYLYRSLMATVVVAKAFGDKSAVETLVPVLDDLAVSRAAR